MSNEAPPVAPRQGGRAGRRAAQEAAREARRADSARKWKKYALPGGIVALVLVVAAGFALFGGDDKGDAAGSPSGRSQTTMLFQVVPSAGSATVGNALTAADPSAGNGVFLALPNRLVTDVPGRGSTTLDQTSVTADGKTAGEAIADQVGVVVDGSWVLTEPAMASLIDKVGGITVDVDTDVTTTTSTGSSVVTVPKGSARQLDGAQAVAYATFLGSGEAEPSRMARFTEVWRSLLEKLPDDTAATRNLIAGSAGSVSSLAPDQLAAYLVALHRAVVAETLAYPTLPTVTIDGGTTVSYRVDSPKLPALAKAHFAGSLPPARAGGPVTVLVQNGVGKPGLTDSARSKLIADGLTYRDGGNATRFGYKTSVVLIPDASAKARENGAAVATALGLPASAVQQSAQGQSLADVVVILGADFAG